MISRFLLAVLVGFTLAGWAGVSRADTLGLAPGTYRVEAAGPDGGVLFEVKNFGMFHVHGSFDRFSGTLALGEDLARSSISATTETASIDTKNSKRDNHLRSADFFEVAKFPGMTFRSTRIAGTEGTVDVTGELTIKGITRTVVFHGKLMHRGLGEASVDAATAINRKDFGVAHGGTIGDEVKISLKVHLRKAEG